MIGGSLGPITVGIDCGGAWNVGKMLQAAEHWPINFGFLGRGNSSKPRSLLDQIQGGCFGLKIHEDWGAMPAVIDTCLSVADELDFQVQLHTDTLNESGFLEDTLAAINGRTIHMYHTEGAGGGHAPDIIRVAGVINCLPSSTNPTNPYTVNTFDEHLDMTMVCHHLSPSIPEDVAFAESRIRPQTIAAEDILHDLGAISMLGSDSQGMGRIHEVICRTWQLASKMRDQRGRLKEETTRIGDNERIKRFIAKYTINAARTFGIDDFVGSLEAGKLADVVLWRPAFFGIKPELIVKGGFIAWGAMGDSAASLMTCEPLLMRPQWGAFGSAQKALSASFVNPAAIEGDLAGKLGLTKALLPTRGTRKLNKQHMLHNDACPAIEVNPQTFDVTIDGELAICDPAEVLPLAQRYLLR
jgi:urease subunit alpha